MGRDGVRRTGVLIVAFSFPPENLVGALRPYRFAKYLPEHDVDVQVVTASQQYDSAPGIHWAPHRTLGGRHVAARLLRLGRIALFRLLYPGGEGQALSWTFAGARRARRVMDESCPECVLSTFPPVSAHLVALRLKSRYPHLRWIADFRDPLHGNPVASKRSLAYERFLERLIFRRADVLIANTDAVARRWAEEYPHLRSKIVCVWNGFDPGQQIAPAPLDGHERRHIVHVGEIYGGRHPGLLLESLQRLATRGAFGTTPPLLRLVGDIDRSTLPDPALVDRLMTMGLVDVEPATASPAAAISTMAKADSLLLVDWVGPSSGLQVPAKLYPYALIGRPILAITTRHSPVDRILARSGAQARCLYPDDPTDIIDSKVIEFVNLPTDPKLPNDWFMQTFNGERQVADLARLIKNERLGPAVVL